VIHVVLLGNKLRAIDTCINIGPTVADTDKRERGKYKGVLARLRIG
jgi:hypothetical protein